MPHLRAELLVYKLSKTFLSQIQNLQMIFEYFDKEYCCLSYIHYCSPYLEIRDSQLAWFLIK